MIPVGLEKRVSTMRTTFDALVCERAWSLADHVRPNSTITRIHDRARDERIGSGIRHGTVSCMNIFQRGETPRNS